MASSEGKRYRLSSLNLEKPGLLALLFRRSFIVGIADYVFHIGLYGSAITGVLLEIAYLVPRFAGMFTGLGWQISWLHAVTGILLLAGGLGFVARYFKNSHFRLAWQRIFYLDLVFMVIIAVTGLMQVIVFFGLMPVGVFTIYPLAWASNLHVMVIGIWMAASLIYGGAARHGFATVVWRFTSSEKKDAIFAAFSDACGRCGRCIAVCPLYEAPPCSENCPAHVDVSSYLARIRSGQPLEAARILVDRNPIPSITGLVCPGFCASRCNRSKSDEPVFVRGVEGFVGEYILDNSADVYKAPLSDSGKTVAIVGSGPAGLSAAYYLRKVGHRVTVFDKRPEPGGMLTYGIPSYRLPKAVIRRQVAALQTMGIEFKLGINIGSDLTLENLRKGFDSLFIATGAWRHRTLGIEREELLMSGLEFLINANLGIQKAPGRRVLVIGGGSVAVDVAITAIRLGSEQVTMACLESRDEMPAVPEDVKRAIDEGIVIMPSWGPHRVLESEGRISAMELVRCTSVFDSKGHFSPTFDPNVRKTVETDQVIVAIGQAADLSYASSLVEINRGLIVVNKDTQATNIPGVFAGGDATTGTAFVVQAITAGRKAAASINSYLRGESSIDETYSKSTLPELISDQPERTGRVKVSEPLSSEHGLDAKTRYLDIDAVMKEAGRCLQCGFYADEAHAEPPLLTLKRYSKLIADPSVPASEIKLIAERLKACRLCGLCVAVCPFSFDFVDVRKRLLSRTNELRPELLAA